MIDRKTALRLVDSWNAWEVLRGNAILAGLVNSVNNARDEQAEIENALLNSGYCFRYENDGARIALY